MRANSKAKAIALPKAFSAKFWLTAAFCAILTGMLASTALAATTAPAAAAKAEAKTEAKADAKTEAKADAKVDGKAEDKKADLLDVIEGDHTLGSPDAPVTIIEYASLSCPHCADFHKTVFPQIQKDYIDQNKVFFIYRNFPFNEPALRGAMVAECSGDKYFTFLKVLFGSQEKWAFASDPVANLRTIANVGGINNEQFDKCIADKAVEDRLIAGVNWAAKDLGVQSTPTLFINGEKIEGGRGYDVISSKIDGYLSKKN